MRISLFLFISATSIFFAQNAQAQNRRQREAQLIKRIENLESELIKARTEINAYRESTAGALSRIVQLEQLMQKYQPAPIGIDTTPNEISDLGSQIALNPTMIEFDEITHDFGTIDEDKTVEYNFTFTNTGKNPLTIERAFGSCGCTIPEWSKTPILPNQKGSLLVKFDPKDKKGSQQKIITVIANTIPSQTQLYIKANVKNKK
jgi:hypothetical protein